MIRAVFMALSLSSAAVAQTPVEISAANDLRPCVLGIDGFRDLSRLGQFEISIERLRQDTAWGQLSEIAPGIFHLRRNGTDRTIEIKLRDDTGAAHCLIFGPSIGPGQGALTADKMTELGYTSGMLRAEQPGPGMTRRYTIVGAPHKAEIVSFVSPQAGEIVGYMLAGVPPNQTTRRLSSGNPNINQQMVQTAISNAMDVCLRNFFSRETVDAAVQTHGFEFGHAAGNDARKKIYFTPDNSVSISVQPGLCDIETNYASVSTAVQLASQVLNRAAPGGFTFRNENHNGCPGFFAARSLNIPLFLTFHTLQRRGSDNCFDDGTSRIGFGVAG